MGGPEHDGSEQGAPAERASGLRRRWEQRLRASPHELPHHQLREPSARLAGRWEEEPAPRPAPGDRLAMHPQGVRVRKVAVNPGPNAPLLMRIVRSPFALQPVGHTRVAAREPRGEAAAREVLGQPGAAWRELRAELAFPNPIRSLPHRPEPRPRPRSSPSERAGGDA